MTDILTPPNVLIDRSKELNDQFYLILNEVVKTYPSAKLYPDGSSKYDRNQKNDALYQSNLSALHALQNEYFMYKNQVVKTSQNILQTVMNIDAQITIIENKNKVLGKQFDNLKSNSYSAEGLFDDAQITRNELLVSNFILFGVICGGGFMFYKKLQN
jgi:hypothetical protein